MIRILAPSVVLLVLTAGVAAAAPQAKPAATTRAGAAPPPVPPTPLSCSSAPIDPPALPAAAGSAPQEAAGYQPHHFLDRENDRRVLRPTRFGLSAGGGIGLIRSGSPYTLAAGEIAAGLNVMNYDRNPGDIDAVEGMVQVALGITDRIEAFVRLSPRLRTNSVGQDPLGWPVPPLDLFVDTYPTAATRSDPTFLYAQEFPFKTYDARTVNIDPPGNGAHSRSSGFNVVGLKWNVWSEDRGDRVGLGVRPFVELRTEIPGYNTGSWPHDAGSSGKNNLGFDVLLAKTAAEAEVLVNVGYVHVGDPERGVRVQMVDSGTAGGDGFLVGDPVETRLDLHDLLSLQLGFTAPVFKIDEQDVWLIAELSYTRYVGGGTGTERLVHPAELRLGLQYNFPFSRAIAFGFAWQLLFNDAGDGQMRSSNLLTPDGRGDINFGELVDAELSEQVKRYFAERGATFSAGSSKVFATDNTAFDPWRNVSPDPQRVVGQGGGAALFWVSWQIASLW